MAVPLAGSGLSNARRPGFATSSGRAEVTLHFQAKTVLVIPWLPLDRVRFSCSDISVHRIRPAVLVVAAGLQAVASGSESGAVSALRSELEAEFLEATGLRFVAFDCGGDPVSSALELSCEAVDEEGDRFLYRIQSANSDRPASVAAWQPVEQLDVDGLTWLRAPSDAFIDAFARGDWPEIVGTLDAALTQRLSVTGVERMLAPLREHAGKVVRFEPLLYNSPAADAHALEYRIEAEHGSLIGRFRMRADESGKSRISAFLILPQPGSPLAVQLLSDTVREGLRPLVGQPVLRVLAPLADLRQAGDAVEGDLVLADESRIAVRAEQVSTTSDFSDDDYRFRILEASWLVRAHLEAAERPVDDVRCPTRVVPDGSELRCTVVRADGSTYPVRVLRRGGEHRLLGTD